MKKILHPAATRGTADYGWLKANFSFSFGNFFDPNRVGFGKLRVLNDDLIAPAMGFSKHPHANMEIVTIPQTGALRHKDSMGFSEVIQSGEIQIMSAGSGIEHSEINASTTEAISLFQIWVIPETENVAPRYAQEKIAPLLKKENQLTTVIWPKDKAVDSQLYVHQQAYFNIGEFTEDTRTKYTFHQENQGAYIFVINGTVFVDNEQLNKRDALGVWDIDAIELDIKKQQGTSHRSANELKYKVMIEDVEINDNEFLRQFELEIGDSMARIEYSLQDRKIFLTKYEMSDDMEEQGFRDIFIKAIFEQVRERGISVVPTCLEVKSFMRKNRRKYRDLLPVGISI